MGQPLNEIPVQMYSFQRDTYDMYTSVTEECIPMEAHFSSGKRLVKVE